MKIEGYPNLYRIADEAATDFQRIYVSLFWLDLALMIAAGLLGFFQSVQLQNLKWPGIAAVVCVIGSIILKLIIRARKDDSVWFDCRAIAESTKTVAWRYMAGVPPFEMKVSDQEVDKRLLEQIGKIRAAKGAIAPKLSLYKLSGEAITSSMREVRKSSFDERKLFYLNNRLNPERKWYTERARTNSSSSEKVFWTTIFLLGSACVCGIYQIIDPRTPNIIAAIVSAASARMAWGEMKGYKELSQSYSMAANDLESAAELWGHIRDNSEFESNVVQSEEAISREHTMWVAKRVC